GFLLGATVLVILWSIRKLDVATPKEAAFWSSVPVVGASTWPRDPDMLSSLMHDLDDYAPHCEGVTLIVGASLDEAHLARRVAEWDGHRIVKSIDDPQRLLAAGQGGSQFPLARPHEGPRDQRSEAPGANPNMQILTLTGPVPAQALRRAARLADRVMVVVGSGKHSIFQLMKIKGRLGRDQGIGVLLVGLDKDYAMVRDRVGDIERFWHATRTQGADR
ncbi:MAG: Tyrosine-protein kinase Wzc, partial [Myxococcaceae bacterium]|nr:Tyrosine-protein kinase Wzc [Myxococcaceae bacterium]